MGSIAMEINKELQYFPRLWRRYVDDVFAIFDTKSSDIHNFMSLLNNSFPSLKLTVGIENKKQLPFHDVLIIRSGRNKLTFNIFRKDFRTLRYILNKAYFLTTHIVVVNKTSVSLDFLNL